MDIRQIPNDYTTWTNNSRSLPARLAYIQEQLKQTQFGAQAEIVTYRRGGEDYHNLYLKYTAPAFKIRRRPVLITAHWDIVRPGADNCLDNTASLYNLYQIAAKLHQHRQSISNDIIFAWVDAEEECSSYLNGAVEAAVAYDPAYIIDLELTAGGKHVLVNQYGNIDLPEGSIKMEMPLNNAKLAWMSRGGAFLGKLRGTACVTIVDDGDLTALQSSSFCRRWAECHRGTDTFDNWLNLSDMDVFTDFVVGWVLKLDRDNSNVQKTIVFGNE